MPVGPAWPDPDAPLWECEYTPVLWCFPVCEAAPLPEGKNPPELWCLIDTGPGPKCGAVPVGYIPVPVGYTPPLPLIGVAVPENLGTAEATPTKAAATKAEVRILKEAGYRKLDRGNGRQG